MTLDGKVFPTDRLRKTTTNAKGESVDTWYSGKHRRPGANIQAIIHPNGLPIWTCAQQQNIRTTVC